MHRIRAGAVAVVLMTAGLLTGLPGPASAAGITIAAEPPYPTEDDPGVLTGSSPPAGSSCASNGDGCFQKYGDVLWVLDNKVDGLGTYVYWENQLWTGTAWRDYRSGRCNNDVGGGNWARCNKDFYESSSSNYYKAKGSRLRLQWCVRGPGPAIDECTPEEINAAPWVNNNG
jgi:hypothetical protein